MDSPSILPTDTRGDALVIHGSSMPDKLMEFEGYVGSAQSYRDVPGTQTLRSFKVQQPSVENSLINPNVFDTVAFSGGLLPVHGVAFVCRY